MEFKFTKVRENAIDPVINEDGSISVYNIDTETAFDAARKQVIVYRTGLTVNVPEGYVLLVTSPRSNVIRSVSLEKDLILDNTNQSALADQKELTFEYKITTDATPIMYSPGEEIARLFPIKKADFTITVDGFTPAEEVVEEVKEEQVEVTTEVQA